MSYAVRDKRDVCGCHRTCIATADGALHWHRHTCEKPCDWPACLTDGEHAALLAELETRLIEARKQQVASY